MNAHAALMVVEVVEVVAEVMDLQHRPLVSRIR